MTTWYIESSGGHWFLVKAKTKAIAKSEGVCEWGRGFTRLVRPATNDEIAYFISLKSEISEA